MLRKESTAVPKGNGPVPQKEEFRSCHGGRRARKHEDSGACGGRRDSSTSDAWDSFSACRGYPGPKSNSNSFGMMAKPPALPCRDDVIVESGDAAPKSCLPPLEMRTTTAAGGLLSTGKTSTATTTLNESSLWLYTT